MLLRSVLVFSHDGNFTLAEPIYFSIDTALRENDVIFLTSFLFAILRYQRNVLVEQSALSIRFVNKRETNWNTGVLPERGARGFTNWTAMPELKSTVQPPCSLFIPPATF